MAISTYFSVRKLNALDEEVARQARKSHLAYVADDGFEMQTNGTRAFLLTGDDDALKHRQEGITQANTSMEQLGPLLQTDRGKDVYGRMRRDDDELTKI